MSALPLSHMWATNKLEDMWIWSAYGGHDIDSKSASQQEGADLGPEFMFSGFIVEDGSKLWR